MHFTAMNKRVAGDKDTYYYSRLHDSKKVRVRIITNANMGMNNEKTSRREN